MISEVGFSVGIRAVEASMEGLLRLQKGGQQTINHTLFRILPKFALKPGKGRNHLSFLLANLACLCSQDAGWWEARVLGHRWTAEQSEMHLQMNETWEYPVFLTPFQETQGGYNFPYKRHGAQGHALTGPVVTSCGLR